MYKIVWVQEWHEITVYRSGGKNRKPRAKTVLVYRPRQYRKWVE